jgi:hypothetical protein
MTINDNKENLRQKSYRLSVCHKSANDEGALVMMC